MSSAPMILGGAVLGGLALALVAAMATGSDAATAPRRRATDQWPERPGVYFTWHEFERTSRPVDNTLPDWARPRIEKLVQVVLDPLRIALQRPVRVSNGFRSDELNRVLHGAPNSQHKRGEAADIDVDGMTSLQLATAIVQLRLPFDQVIWYAPGVSGHVHVSVAYDRAQRGEMLEGYRNSQGQKVYRAWTPKGVV